jgi:hypothetical protein
MRRSLLNSLPDEAIDFRWRVYFDLYNLVLGRRWNSDYAVSGVLRKSGPELLRKRTRQGKLQSCM